jgi:hypothetical protein
MRPAAANGIQISGSRQTMENSYYNLVEAVENLDEQMRRNRLIAGSNITIENTGAGIKINSLGEATAGALRYNGFFKVINTGEDATFKVKAVDGTNKKSGICGYVTLIDGAARVRVPVNSMEFDITMSCSIYLEINLRVMTAVIRKGEPSMPSTPTGKFYILLADITVEENLSINQIHKGGEVFINSLKIYAGPFTIQDISDENVMQVRVCNGANPDDPIAGMIYHGINYPVEAETFTIDESGTGLFLFLRFLEDGYSCGIVRQADLVIDDYQYASIYIGYARVINGAVSIAQNLQDNWTITGRIA